MIGGAGDYFGPFGFGWHAEGAQRDPKGLAQNGACGVPPSFPQDFFYAFGAIRELNHPIFTSMLFYKANI